MRSQLIAASSLLGAATASVILYDPSDTIPYDEWSADNALLADYNIDVPAEQPHDIWAAYSFEGSDNDTSIDHETFTVDANDTSVILVADGANLNLTFSEIVKYGYSTNLNDASFYGFNAAVNVANDSSAEFDHVNITVHNGAANIYAYGTGTLVNVSNAWLYSSGPVSHGLYASGNGTIYGSHITQFSGGYRSSAFSGDSPAGYIYVSESTAHTEGVGSACFYALGEIHADTVNCETDNAPMLFMDGIQSAELKSVNAKAGLLAGTIMFSSSVRSSGGFLSLIDSRLETLGDTMPGLWFGNTIGFAEVVSSEIVTASGVLVAANFSQVTQDFDYFASYEDNTSLQPALAYVTVSESTLTGDLVAYNSSYISWTLGNYSTWTGTAYSGYADATFDVALDETSTWVLTADTYLQNFTDSDTTLSNVESAGFDVYYNCSALLNDYLDGQTISLSGGGSAIPY